MAVNVEIDKFYLVYITELDGYNTNIPLVGCTEISTWYGGYNRHGHNVKLVKATDSTITSSLGVYSYAVMKIV